MIGVVAVCYAVGPVILVRRLSDLPSLGVVAAYLRARGELHDAILVPVDAHPEMFGLWARRAQVAPRARCDLMCIRFQRGRCSVTPLIVFT